MAENINQNLCNDLTSTNVLVISDNDEKASISVENSGISEVLVIEDSESDVEFLSKRQVDSNLENEAVVKDDEVEVLPDSIADDCPASTVNKEPAQQVSAVEELAVNENENEVLKEIVSDDRPASTPIIISEEPVSFAEELANTSQDSENFEDKSDVVLVSDVTTTEISDQDQDISTDHQKSPTTTESKASQTTECTDGGDGIHIRFSNELIANLYKSKLIAALRNFIELKITHLDALSVDVVQCDESNDSSVRRRRDPLADETTIAQSNELCDPDTTTSVSPSPSKKRKKKSRSTTKRELFVVDANPSDATLDDEIVFRYTSKFTILESDVNGAAVANEKKPQSRFSCFNCGEHHQLKDCKKPRDFVKINAARQNHKFTPKTTLGRYHVEEQKFGSFVPGKISNDLRQALGLRKSELPHYVYLMRRLGYPPGWLEDAKHVHSNLSIYGGEGKNLGGLAKKSATSSLDPDKIVEYPGFNMALEKGQKDDYRAFGVPPYSDNFSKAAMLSYFEKQFAKEVDNLEACDMDIDENDVQENNSMHDSTTISLNNDSKAIQHLTHLNDKARGSPSLNELELKKRELLDELNHTGSPVVGNLMSSPLIDDDKKAGVVAAGGDNDDDNSNGSPTKINNKSVTVCYGTPILKSTSPYMSLPNADNFMKDVSPVINFENLPNSTGKYEQMTDVIQKVRSTLKKVQNCGS